LSTNRTCILKELAILDLIVKGGTVVTPGGAGLWDIGIQGEKIVSVALPGTLTEAKKTIDATGKTVIPGGVEAHTHVGFPHLVSVWGSVTSGPEELSLGALWGGTTTMFDFAKVTMDDPKNVAKAMNDHMAHFKGRMYIDYSAHASYYGPTITVGNIDQIKELVQEGFPSIKVYTTNHAPKPGRPLTMIGTGQLVDVMEACAKYGGIVAIHSEEDEIVQWNYEKARQNEEMEWYYLPKIRSNLSEMLSVRRCVAVAEHTGAAMYIVHTSAKEGVEAIAESRAKGHPVDGETILLYCSFNSDDYKKPDGMKHHTYPSTKSETDRQRLWQALHRGELNILATDAIGTTYANKIKGRTVLDVQGGNNGIEIRIPVGYTTAVVNQGMSLERFVAIACSNPAKLLGLYPRKGAIAAGSDADLCVLDTTVKKKISPKDLHLNDYTPWEGWEVRAWPTTVTLRGKVMIDNGKLLAKPTDGQLIKRKIDSRVLNRPI